MLKSKSLNKHLESRNFLATEEKTIVLFFVKWEYFFGTPVFLAWMKGPDTSTKQIHSSGCLATWTI